MVNARYETYAKILQEIAAGKSDIWGYCNLEHKLTDDIKDILWAYRDTLVRKGRKDRFLVPEKPHNVALVDTERAKPGWKHTLRPRFVPAHISDIACDMYLWDDMVAIVTFHESELSVERVTAPTQVALYRDFLEMLWRIGLDPALYFGPRTSDMTKLERNNYLTGGSNLIDLSVGYPLGLSEPWMKEIARATPAYIESHPARELVKPIEEYFKAFYSPSVCTRLVPSATYAFMIACDAVLKTPGDEIIITDPGYDAYPNVARSFGASVTFSKRKSDQRLDIVDIESKITHRTVAIVICSPENPFGVTHTNEELTALVNLCKQNNITLITDNCFIELDPEGRGVPVTTDIVGHETMQHISIADTGKILDLSGSKFGIMIFSENLSESISNRLNNYFFQYNQFDLGLISQILSDKRFNAYIALVRTIIKANYQVLLRELGDKLEILPLHAGSVGLVNIEKTGMDDVAFSRALMNQSDVSVVPVRYFYSGEFEIETNLIRVALARPLGLFAEGIGRIKKYLDTR